ncbi:MAG: hypothetical protein AAGH15_28040, partial [Myxococcota bacterium]
MAASPTVRAAGSCDGLAGYGEHAAGSPALDWSRVHGNVRFFGLHRDPFAVDVALVGALGGEGAQRGEVRGDAAGFEAYATDGPETCFVGSWPAASPPPSAIDPSVQWAAPGVPFALADAAEHVIVDLRSAPEGPALEAFLSSIVREAVAGEVLLEVEARVFDGMRDEAWAPFFVGREGVYRSTVGRRPLAFRGTGRSVGLGFLVGDRLAPAAARLVLALRTAGPARILGQPVPTRVAETLTVPAAEGGFAFRALRLRDAEGELLPDVVPADVPFDTMAPMDLEARFLASVGAPAAPLDGAANRGGPLGLPAETRFLDTDRHEGTRQAALIATHAAATLFFPYWDVVTSDRDARLEDALALPADEGESEAEYGFRSLRFFSNALEDSHGITWFA